MGKFKVFINEGSLQRNNLRVNPERFDIFKQKIQKHEEFELIDNTKCIILDNILDILTVDPASIPSMISTSVGPLSLSKFKKTAEFGSNKGSGGGTIDTKINESAQCIYCAIVYAGDLGSFNLANDIKKYNKKCDINANLDDIINLPKTWVDSSIAIAQRIKQEFSGDFNFHRGSKMVDVIESKFRELNKKAGNVLKNINKWNPSDIWLVKDEGLVIKEISKMTNLVSYNSLIARLFKDEILIGISLKKVSLDTTIPYSVYNLDSISTKIKYNGHSVSKNNKLFDDAIDVYLKFNFGENNDIQLRNTGGKTLAWQGEVSGGLAKGGKIGGGIILDFIKQYGGVKLKYPNEVAKLVKNRDKKFITEFYTLTQDYYKMSRTDFDKRITKVSDTYIYSKYLGLKVIQTIDKSSKKDLIIANIVGYAISSTVNSSIFVKIGK